MIHPYQKRTWAEINIHNLQYNFDVVRNAVGSAKVCCVIKANAYGHGAIKLAQMYQKRGADCFAVSNIEEALQLRTAGITLPILILGYSDPECAEILSKNDISQCVFSKEYAELLAENAAKKDVTVKVHIKIDTGMGRLGFDGRTLNSRLDELESIYKLHRLFPEGIFTHFASADEGDSGKEYTYKQFECFCRVIEYLQNKGIDVGIRHCANSAAIFEYPEMHLDMVRAGIVLYGEKPSGELKHPVDLKPALQLKTIIDFIKDVRTGECISYGREFCADRDMKIATLPIGYADGLWRSNFKNNMVVEINGKYAPVVGRICMDQCMVDISAIPDVKSGTKVTVYGLFGKTSVDEVAKRNETINYEILCAIGERVPRVYIEGSTVIDVQDNIIGSDILV